MKTQTLAQKIHAICVAQNPVAIDIAYCDRQIEMASRTITNAPSREMVEHALKRILKYAKIKQSLMV